MVHFEINGKKYYFCHTKEDISIKRFVQIIELEKSKLPDCLRKLQQLNIERSKLQQDENEDHTARLNELEDEIKVVQDNLYSQENEPAILEWQINLAVALSNCPLELWKKVDYNSFLTMLEFGYAALDQIHNYQPKHIKSIYWKEEDWLLPAEHLVDMTLGRMVQIKEFQRQAQQLNNGYFPAILNMLPVILLKKDEQYSFGLYEQRKVIFEDLPVCDAIDVGFFLTSKVNASNYSTHIYSIAAALSKLKKRRKR